MSEQLEILEELRALLDADRHDHYFAVCWECPAIEEFATKRGRDAWMVYHEHALVGPRAP